ncbi:Endothelial differentiation factor 1 [Fasciola hepatica]|uniref:Endothelial differentiation factor 1 n=1 Tax=Fasciola hepatica TaxID=6192 RepID=A0A4E0QW90_FASHE|nr:Endothelial differentiation factor 1 [Fasciola hepatica]
MAEGRTVTLKTNSSFSAAQRRGDPIETHKRWAAGQNKQRPIDKNTAKLDEETENFHNDMVDIDVGRIIMQTRQEKGITQKELATKINEKPQVIADYEQGRAIKNQVILSKIERALGVKLRGKDKGQPLGGPRKK